MDYISTPNGRVGHIVAGVFDTADGRVVTTVCNKTFAESEIGVNNDLDACSACTGKEEKLVEKSTDTVLTIDEVETKPSKASEKNDE